MIRHELRTERLILRPLARDDYDLWEVFFCSDRARYIRGENDGTVGKASRGFLAMIGHWTLHGEGNFSLVSRETGNVIGMAGAYYPKDWPEKEIGWTMWDPAFEGKGLMCEAVTRIRRHLYQDLGWTTAVSYIEAGNTRSIALAERLGATYDADAIRPKPETLVYRHPHPEALS